MTTRAQLLVAQLAELEQQVDRLSEVLADFDAEAADSKYGIDMAYARVEAEIATHKIKALNDLLELAVTEQS